MINLPLATNSWDEREHEAIQRVINSNRFSMGKEVEEFEKEFAEYFGSKYAVMVNSGSSANLLAIAALFFSEKYKLERGDEVIVPAVSWATTYTPLQQYGLKVKFVDIDRDTLNIDLDSLNDAITERTKAVFAVNLLGNPTDYKKLNSIGNEYNLMIIEDNCESMGAKLNNKYTGTFGIMGTFSTFFSHHIATMEGGVIVTDDEELRDILFSLRAHGWTRNLNDKSSIYNKKDDTFYESFNFILPGYNVRPIEMEAAIGREQLKKLPQIIRNRRKNGENFKALFSQITSVHIQKEVGKSSFFGFAIIIDKNANFKRKQLVYKLKENGVECRPIVAGNFIKNKAIKYFDYCIHGELVNSDYIHNNGLFIGNHHYNIEEKLDQIYQLIKGME